MSHDYQLTVGVEVHCQLATSYKLFSRAGTGIAPANTQIEPPDFGLPGALPVLSPHVVELAARTGFALGCTVHPHSAFDRKHYFYPDSPKGYQITQQYRPLCTHGRVTLNDAALKPRCVVRIARIHIEEDAAKSTHTPSASLLDFNRAGTPLIEIVSEPDMHEPDEVVAFLKELHLIVTSIGVCEGNLERGEFRVDVNVSMAPRDAGQLGERVEIKNLNSFKFVRDAIVVEAARQRELLAQGGAITRHTRHYDADTRRTLAMRQKESAADYRFFPDPDLPPLHLTCGWIEQVRATLPELPDARRERYVALGVRPSDVVVIVDDVGRTSYFEQALDVLSGERAVPLLATWLVQQWPSILEHDIEPVRLAELISMVYQGSLHRAAARKVFELMREDRRVLQEIAQTHDLLGMGDSEEIARILDEVLASNPRQLAEYRAGKTALLGYFMGQVIGLGQGKLDPVQVKDLLVRKLES